MTHFTNRGKLNLHLEGIDIDVWPVPVLGIYIQVIKKNGLATFRFSIAIVLILKRLVTSVNKYRFRRRHTRLYVNICLR